MQIEVNGYTYAVTTGGYESAIPSDAILDFEEADYQTRAVETGFSADKLNLAEIYSSDICDRPFFSIQYGRSSEVNEHTTYQVFGDGIESLEAAEGNISDISIEVEENFRDTDDFSTHRPFIKTHSRLADGSILYIGVYYYGRSADSIKRLEMRTLHPNIPFGIGRYEEIFDTSPARTPQYLESVEIKRYRLTDISEYAIQIVKPKISLNTLSSEILAIENPITQDNVPEDVWGSFQSLNHIFAKSYLLEEENSASEIADFRAVSIGDLEPIFYQAEVQ